MGGCGVAVLADDVAVSRSDDRARGQSEYLVPMVENAMKEAGLEFSGLDAIVTTVGPGAFTGLRIGLSAAKAYALSLNIPIYGITSLQALALSVVAEKKVSGDFMVLVETRRDDFYMQRFSGAGAAIGGAQAIDIADIETVLAFSPVSCIVGDAVKRFEEQSVKKYSDLLETPLPDPLVIARCFQDDEKRELYYTKDVEPVYLRGADVSLSKKEYRTLA